MTSSLCVIATGAVTWTADSSITHTDVAVKILKPNASSEARSDFLSEIRIMNSFKHDHILALLALVEAGE